mmetsp:Transcript_16151/g.20027  ORF Transcript_16151/g.20027 Transcript_16151/m.20027 type:complete len:216 (-) Transcript_16151:1031-1678(-)|eukprot:CAMPEP_0204882406 /NCGR_PEP_ID=MMETSP1349-20130617/3433_1 /ASSEMBLY_ACC=CAM_ASM_000710 /TAXON_ID=215587 /ORGANISM="Aplanochytrium stocchinoi, Strain GSBS06" /LENGTH=215 /DNA_ID=CAMNT_0052041719 /DNA_START=174 /DNA_END=821 /DNA_ORIENTATION=-
MADELIALFGKITTSDHDQLLEQFSKILQVEPNVSQFFLEASNWNVETAVHNYLASVGNSRNQILLSSPPQAVFLGDISVLQNRIFPQGSRVNLQLAFRNVGKESWPRDTRLSFVDGHIMGGQEMTPLAAPPGGDVGLTLHLVAPSDQGTYMGSWRLACSAGYFGDAIYIILAVSNEKVDVQQQAGIESQNNIAMQQEQQQQQFQSAEDAEMSDL